MFADRDYVINDAIIKPTEATKEADQSEIRDICMIIKEKLAFANIVIPADAKIILSFHEGFDKFLCTGCVQILCFDTRLSLPNVFPNVLNPFAKC